jgi:hypothetical protein
MKVIKASELGTYLFCHRAWWYAQKGFTPLNLDELEGGKVLHERHGKRVQSITWLRITSYVFLFISIILFIIYGFSF